MRTRTLFCSRSLLDQADFLPKDAGLEFLATPTNPCLLLTALLTGLRAAARQHLDATNASALLHEVANRLHAALLASMLKWQYNAGGRARVCLLLRKCGRVLEKALV